MCKKTDLREDVVSFKAEQDKNLNIFLERRGQYGNHLENDKRFPKEDTSGFYLKCVRAIRDIDDNIPVNEDTLRDLSNYACIILSTRENPNA